jgi:hypothetical protein
MPARTDLVDFFRRATAWPVLRQLIFLILLLAVLVYSFLGFQQKYKGDFYDNMYRTLALITVDNDFADLTEPPPQSDAQQSDAQQDAEQQSDARPTEAAQDETDAGNKKIALARFLAPLLIFIALLYFFMDLIRQIGKSCYRQLRMKDHTVVIGLSAKGKQFALSERSNGQTVAVIEVADPAASELFCHLHRILFVAGDASEDRILKRARVGKAKHVIIETGNDTRNLSIADAVIAVKKRHYGDDQKHDDLEKRQTTRSENLNKNPSPEEESHPESRAAQTVFLHISNPTLTEGLNRREIFSKHRDFEVRSFSLARLAAIDFFNDHPIWSYAILRAQPRLHAAFLGFDETAEQILLQMCRISPHPQLEEPIATIFTEEPERTRAGLLSAFPELPQACRLVHKKFPPTEAGAISEDLMADVESQSGISEPGSPLTAIFVCLGEDHESLAAAMQLRLAAQRAGRWRAPIFVHLKNRSGFANLLENEDSSRTFEDVFESFGPIDDLCRLEKLLGHREKLSEKIHREYRRYLAKRHPDRLHGPNGRPWRDLGETYREANRRAVDHLPVKLAGVGWSLVTDNEPTGRALSPDPFHFDVDTKDTLARLEHQSWQVDRWLDGWRYGRWRDNSRRVHDCLCDFDDLSKEQQAYDYQMIDVVETALSGFLQQSNKIALKEFRIGLVGFTDVYEDNRKALTDELLACLGDQEAQLAGRHVTLITTLTPGSELLMARETADFLKSRVACRTRLLVIEAVPYDILVDRFEDAWCGGADWGGAWDGKIEKEWKDVRHVFAKRDNQIEKIVGADKANQWIVNLTPPGMTREDWNHPDAVVLGQRRARAYIAERSDLLIVCRTPDKPEKEDGDRPGSDGNDPEADKLLAWRQNPQRSIPPSLSSLSARQRQTWPFKTNCRQILLEPPNRPAD